MKPIAAPIPAARSHARGAGPATRRRRWPWAWLAVALGALLVAAVAGMLASTTALDARWRSAPQGGLELVGSRLAPLAPLVGRSLQSITAGDGSRIDASLLAVPRAPRWTVDDGRRAAQRGAQLGLARALAAGPVTLQFDDGRSLQLEPRPRGLLGVGALFWLMALAALALAGVGGSVHARQPDAGGALYLAITLVLAAELLLIGAESMPGLGLPAGVAAHAGNGHALLDLAFVALVVQRLTLPPLRAPAPRRVAAAVWMLVTLVGLALLGGRLPQAWWWLQATMLAAAGAALWLCSRSYRVEPNPFVLVARRFTLVGAGTLALLTLAVASAAGHGAWAQGIAAVGPNLWSLFLAGLLLLLPLVSRGGTLVRELALFTGLGTVVLCLHLLFVAGLGLEPYASLALAATLTLLLYALTHRWLLDPTAEPRAPGAARRFEQLYRGMRAIEEQPQQWPTLLPALLRELYEPLELRAVPEPATRTRVLDAGAALLVAAPQADGAARWAWRLRFAGRGRRIFSVGDARLADAVIEQVRRALAQEHAVERGRLDERARIAQDLHDDIGARLLTLIYRAPSAELEDYLRHTLKNLKTLTRGLAAADYRLSDAAAEWKSDVAQRLALARIGLDWSMRLDRDPLLRAPQWSALTRVLRELVSNVIQHSAATQLWINLTVEGGLLRLVVADDGIGRNPQGWAQGLGLGGVRKRIRQLGGEVYWGENGSAGIACTVVVPDLQAPAT